MLVHTYLERRYWGRGNLQIAVTDCYGSFSNSPTDSWAFAKGLQFHWRYPEKLEDTLGHKKRLASHRSNEQEVLLVKIWKEKIYFWMDIFWVMRRIFSPVFYRQHPSILLARYQEDRWVYIFRENVVLLPKLWNKMHMLHSHIWIIGKKML